MATTPTGLPYPVGTDKVVDGDDAIKNLALGVDVRPAAFAYLATSVSAQASTITTLGKAPLAAWTKELIGGITLDDALGEFTLPYAGLYQTSLGVRYDSTSTGANRLAWIETVTGPNRVADWVTSGAQPVTKIVGGVRTFRATAGTKIRVMTYQDSTGPLTVVGAATPGTATFFEIRLVGS